MGNTKKVKSAGRYGAKFGVGLRKRLVKVESKQKKKVKCPKCGFKKIKRLAIGIYNCKKCNAKFSGGAYFPNTLSGTIVRKMVSQKSFLPNLAELTAIKETEIAEVIESKDSAKESTHGKKHSAEAEGQKQHSEKKHMEKEKVEELAEMVNENV